MLASELIERLQEKIKVYGDSTIELKVKDAVGEPNYYDIAGFVLYPDGNAQNEPKRCFVLEIT